MGDMMGRECGTGRGEKQRLFCQGGQKERDYWEDLDVGK
jgi:hypothetical protein